MGLGDDLIFLGKAEEIYKKTGKKIVPVYGTGWSPLFDNVEFLSKNKTPDTITVNARDTDKPVDVHIDYYIKKKTKTILGEKLVFRNFKPIPFRVRLTEKENANFEIDNFCIINPDYKSSFFSGNKNWGFHKYQELTNRLSEYITCVRIMPANSQYNEPALKNAINITKDNIRESIAIMSKARFGVSYDGLLQHVFAGFEIPCVVIQGGLVDTNVMSYDTNIHHTYKHPMTPCGSTFDCAHCKEANDAITVDEVFESCIKVLNESSSNPS